MESTSVLGDALRPAPVIRPELGIERLDAEYLRRRAIAQAHAGIGVEDHQRRRHGFDHRQQIVVRGFDAAPRFARHRGELARFVQRLASSRSRICTALAIFANELNSTPISSSRSV